MEKIQCTHCRSRLVPNPHMKNQRYCSKIECQRARKASWQRQKLATDPDYQANKRESQSAWRGRNPGYWRNWRARHPEYVQRNRIRQQDRRSRVAKMDASALKVQLILMA